MFVVDSTRSSKSRSSQIEIELSIKTESIDSFSSGRIKSPGTRPTVLLEPKNSDLLDHTQVPGLPTSNPIVSVAEHPTVGSQLDVKPVIDSVSTSSVIQSTGNVDKIMSGMVTSICATVVSSVPVIPPTIVVSSTPIISSITPTLTSPVQFNLQDIPNVSERIHFNPSTALKLKTGKYFRDNQPTLSESTPSCTPPSVITTTSPLPTSQSITIKPNCPPPIGQSAGSLDKTWPPIQVMGLSIQPTSSVPVPLSLSTKPSKVLEPPPAHSQVKSPPAVSQIDTSMKNLNIPFGSNILPPGVPNYTDLFPFQKHNLLAMQQQQSTKPSTGYEVSSLPYNVLHPGVSAVPEMLSFMHPFSQELRNQPIRASLPMPPRMMYPAGFGISQLTPDQSVAFAMAEAQTRQQNESLKESSSQKQSKPKIKEEPDHVQERIFAEHNASMPPPPGMMRGYSHVMIPNSSDSMFYNQPRGQMLLPQSFVPPVPDLSKQLASTQSDVMKRSPGMKTPSPHESAFLQHTQQQHRPHSQSPRVPSPSAYRKDISPEQNLVELRGQYAGHHASQTIQPSFGLPVTHVASIHNSDPTHQVSIRPKEDEHQEIVRRCSDAEESQLQQHNPDQARHEPVQHSSQEQFPPPQPPAEDQTQLSAIERHPILLTGVMELKNNQATIQLHYVSGSMEVANRSLRMFIGANQPVRVTQRMRIEPTQLSALERKIQVCSV